MENQEIKNLQNSALIFARALGLLLQENQGVIVDVIGDIDFGGVKKVVVFSQDGGTHVSEASDEFPEGTVVQVVHNEE